MLDRELAEMYGVQTKALNQIQEITYLQNQLAYILNITPSILPETPYTPVTGSKLLEVQQETGGRTPVTLLALLP